MEAVWPFIPGSRMASISRLFRSGLIMVSIMIVTMLYLNVEKKSQSQLKLTQHGTVEIPIETFRKKPILVEPDERRYHINSTKVRYFNTKSPWDLKNKSKSPITIFPFSLWFISGFRKH